MYKNYFKHLVLASLIFLVSCVGSGLQYSKDSNKTAFESNNSKVFPAIAWEPAPRSIVEGNDGQLSIRASEAMNFLYAAVNKEGKQDLFLTRSRNIGDSFSKSVRTNSETGEVKAHGENGPILRQGKGRGLFAAWVGNRDIKFARSLNFGKSFTPGIKVNDANGKGSFMAMEVGPNGEVFVVWLDGRDKKKNSIGTTSIYLARSMDKGRSFSKNIKISGEICPCCRPSIAFGSNGKVFVSWRHVYKDNERVIVVASSNDGGETWGEPVRVTSKGWKINGCAHSGPTMKYINGKLFLAWYTAAEGQVNLKMTVSRDNGRTFIPAKNIQGSVVDANHPHMEVFGDAVWIIFQGRDPQIEGGWGQHRAWVVQASNDGVLSEPHSLPTAGGGVVYPHLFKGHGGRVYAMWTEVNDKGPHVILCRGRFNLDRGSINYKIR